MTRRGLGRTLLLFFTKRTKVQLDELHNFKADKTPAGYCGMIPWVRPVVEIVGAASVVDDPVQRTLLLLGGGLPTGESLQRRGVWELPRRRGDGGWVIYWLWFFHPADYTKAAPACPADIPPACPADIPPASPSVLATCAPCCIWASNSAVRCCCT